ncbi:hypothetical protein [Mesoplasma florum]|nr:hypothetical protein [Mesoplasma florum]
MTNKEYYEEFETELEENNDAEFIASFSALKRYQKKNYLKELTYLGSEVKNFYFYPLTTLTGRELTEGIRIAKEKTTIMCTTPDKGIKIQLFMEKEDSTYELNEFTDPANFSEQLIKNSKRISGVFDFNADVLKLTDKQIQELDDNQIKEYASALEEEMKLFDITKLYLITEEELTDENFDSVPKYLNQRLTYNSTEDEYDIDFVPIDEFTSLYDAQPLIIENTEPIKGKIKEINVTTPVGTLIGNIKLVNKKGHQPALIAAKGTELFPMLTFPRQTTPNLATTQYWGSRQIIMLQEIFSFLDSKNIAYDQEFSLADFLKLGSNAGDGSINVPRPKTIKYNETIEVDRGEWISSSGAYFWRPKIVQEQREKTIEIGSEYFEEYVRAGNRTSIQDIYSKVIKLENVRVSSNENIETSEAFETIKKMLTESFWKDLEFKGAIKTEFKNGQYVETIADENIYLRSQKYAGQDRYSVTTNLWLSWKRQNQDLVNANPEIIKRIENALAMLSGYIKCNYSINKGDNDDYKILLPYYFELQNKLVNPSSWQVYEDIRVKLKSNYGLFSKEGFTFTNKDISKAKIYELDYNHFAFIELTKNVETASIPSSAPLDQQTANGEYSKYLMHNFSNTDINKKLLKNRYGSGSMDYDPIGSTIYNSGYFEVNEDYYEELVLSAFYGYGEWIIDLISNDELVTIKKKLFSKSDSTKTLINLII